MPFADGIMLFIVFIFDGILIYKMIKTYKNEDK